MLYMHQIIPNQCLHSMDTGTVTQQTVLKYYYDLARSNYAQPDVYKVACLVGLNLYLVLESGRTGHSGQYILSFS